MSKLTEIAGQLDDRRQKAAALIENGVDDLTPEQVQEFRTLNDEMTDLGKQRDELQELEDMQKHVKDLGELKPHIGHPQGETKGGEERKERKTLGEMFVDSPALKGWSPGTRMGPEAEMKIGVKNLFERSTGWEPWDDRRDLFVDALRQPLWILDLIDTAQTNSNVIVYLQQEPFVNSAATVAEGAAKPEASLNVERVTEIVEKVAVALPVTDEQLADVSQARSFIDSQLSFMVREELEQQVLSGDGTSPNLHGLLASDRLAANGGGVQAQALGGDTVPDAVYKAIVKVRVTGRDEPTAAVFHPNDWTPVRLLKTSDGMYIWGPPMDPGPERIWGLRVVQTTGMTENTALVGNFRRAILFQREGLTMKVGYVDDQFIKNTQTILAELRAALAVVRETSFCTVTGI